MYSSRTLFLYSVALLLHPDLGIPWPSHYSSNEKFCTTSSYHMNFYILGNSQFNITVINVWVGFRALHMSSLLEIYSTSRLPKSFLQYVVFLFCFFLFYKWCIPFQNSWYPWPKKSDEQLCWIMCAVTIGPSFEENMAQKNRIFPLSKYWLCAEGNMTLLLLWCPQQFNGVICNLPNPLRDR